MNATGRVSNPTYMEYGMLIDYAITDIIVVVVVFGLLANDSIDTLLLKLFSYIEFSCHEIHDAAQ